MAYDVLLVEDDPAIALVVLHYLNNEEFNVTHCANAREVDTMDDEPFDVVLLDIVLPGTNGFDICSRLRAKHDCPIIFISCLDDSDSIVKALEMGGDDYLTKPFDGKVLRARIMANLRRAGNFHHDTQMERTYTCASFALDTATRSVRLADGSTSELTPLEFQLLLFLMRNPQTFYSSEELYHNVWGQNSYGDASTVVVLVHGLRKKLERDGGARHLVNKRGRGYAFLPEGA